MIDLTMLTSWDAEMHALPRRVIREAVRWIECDARMVDLTTLPTWDTATQGMSPPAVRDPSDVIHCDTDLADKRRLRAMGVLCSSAGCRLRAREGGRCAGCAWLYGEA